MGADRDAKKRLMSIFDGESMRGLVLASRFVINAAFYFQFSVAEVDQKSKPIIRTMQVSPKLPVILLR